MFVQEQSGSEFIEYSIIGAEKDTNGAIVSVKYGRSDGSKETTWRADSLVSRHLEGNISDVVETKSFFKPVSVGGKTYTVTVPASFKLKRNSEFTGKREFVPISLD